VNEQSLASASYKESGVDWIGKVPEHWQLLPARVAVSDLVEKNEGARNQDYLSLVAGKGVMPYADKGDMGNKKPDDLSKCKIVRKGNIVINSMNFFIGSYGMSDYEGVCSPVYIVLDVNQSAMDRRFALRVFGDVGFQLYLATFGNGILKHRAAIGWDDIKGAYLPIPPPAEQTQIAKFLDYETLRIDALMEKQQQLIALLKEKRQAVISHAVTKGLNPDAPMRDSGVEWLGEVPAHWGVKKLGHLGKLQNGLNIGGDAFGSGDPFVSYGNVYNNAIVPTRPSGLVKSTADDQKKYSLTSGDVLFTRTSETVDDIGVASTCLQEIPRVTFAGFLIRFRPFAATLDSNYSSFLFRNESIQDFFSGSMNLVTRASLSQNVLKTLPICVPPVDEQIRIAGYLSKTASAFDRLENSLIEQGELLAERRTALISAAVTGKIDVRDWKAPKTAVEAETA
jgi:type I restriction enzyme, S subunit